jgi:hypothetical protein
MVSPVAVSDTKKRKNAKTEEEKNPQYLQAHPVKLL